MPPLTLKQAETIVGDAFDRRFRRRSESKTFKLLELLNRPNSAIFGGLSEAVKGGDPFSAFGEGLRSGYAFSGVNLAELFIKSPKAARNVGLVLDIFNPLDPLNFVGLGGLTKAGRAAKLASGIKGIAGAPKLAKTFGEQAKLDQRGLVTFAGRRVPLPGDAAALDLLQKGGRKLKGSKAGRGVQQLFGRKAGAFKTTLQRGVSQEQAQSLLDAYERGEIAASRFTSDTDPILNTFRKKLKDSELGEALDVFDLSRQDPSVFPDLVRRFVGTGPDAKRRLEAMKAGEEFFKVRKAASSQRLGGFGIDAFAEARPGFLSRRFRRTAGEAIEPPEETFTRLGGTTGETIKLEGVSNNEFNRLLVQPSIQPVSIDLLDEAGQAKWLAGDGKKVEEEWFQSLTKRQQQAFDRKHRLSIKEANEVLKNYHLAFEEHPAKIFKVMQNELAANIRGNELVRSLRDEGLAVPWDEALHGNGKFLKIDQGEFQNAPLALDKIYEGALARMMNVFMPGPDKSLFAQLLNKFLPEHLENLGAQSWWKGFAIFGGGPTAYWTRNFATGVIKNYYEGLGPVSPEGLRQALKFYPEALTIVVQSLRRPLDTSGNLLRGEFVTKQGVRISYKRLMQEYMARRMHGGGSPDPEIIRGFDNLSTAAREKLFGRLHRRICSIQMAMRIPLMLKYIEDTFEVAQQAGQKLPRFIGDIDQTPEVLGDIFDVALTNAKEAVIRAHFDYDDLTPFERSIRTNWLPFYTWLARNLENETINMVQNSGRYMPAVRAYYSAFNQQNITPEDLPEWAQRSFVVPLDPSGEARARWLDLQPASCPSWTLSRPWRP